MNVRRSRALYGGSPPPRQWSMDCPGGGGGGLSCSGPCRPPPERAPPLSRFIPACAGNTSQPWPTRWASRVHPRVCGEHLLGMNVIHAVFGSSPRVRGTRSSIPARRETPTVHPRVCGEHRQTTAGTLTYAGSSPRVRGTQVSGPAYSNCRRFIPACAGNTLSDKVVWDQPTVHPRVCGEHGVCVTGNLLRYGSSPRVRGTRRKESKRCAFCRFIPACAGNTYGHSIRHEPCTVHPRVCGEHQWPATTSSRSSGSSPRVRGTPRWPNFRRPPNRFIPACAGNTSAVCLPAISSAVHPRVCGEHNSRPFPIRKVSGSSPRVRGTRRRRRRRRRRSRFIPACAGNTAAASPCPRRRSVHPRVCGEHRRGHGRDGQGDGSSPRVRGTRQGAASDLLRRRFIPACAGNTKSSRSRRSPNTVHPRVCGEHSIEVCFHRAMAGSSPRVRGTRWRQIGHVFLRRFIPACAGNTCCLRSRLSITAVHPRVCGEHTAPHNSAVVSIGSSPRVRGTPGVCSGVQQRFRFIPACAGNTPSDRRNPR